jgi:hypothetical protein
MSIFLTSTNDLIYLITESAVTIDVYVGYDDLDTTDNTMTPGRSNSAITTATTTTIVSAPGSNIVRKIKNINIKNKHATSSCIVTLQHTDGTTVIELDKRTLYAGDSININENGEITPLPLDGKDTPSYYGIIAGAYGDGEPNRLMKMVQTQGVATPTPTNITTSIARCCLFRLPFDLTVNKIRFYGTGYANNAFRTAIYRYSDKKRLTDQLELSSILYVWGYAGNQDSLGLELSKDVLYFIAVSVTDSSGTDYGPIASGATVAATTGQIQTVPQSLPGSLSADGPFITTYNFQFAVTNGVLPDPAPTLAAQDAWTGGMPAFWLDSDNS